MKKLFLFLKDLGFVFGAAATTLALIFLCFFIFRMRVDSYIVEDMHAQIQAIQKNSVLLMQNEMNYLVRLTASAAQMVSRTQIQTDEDILNTLRGYASTSSITGTLFITLDGHVYTNYAGYLGQSAADTSIDGIPLSEITDPIFTQPYYADDLYEIVFDVVAPAAMGNKKGVLVSSYNIKEFSRLLESKLIDGSAEVGIINNKGEVVSGKSDDEFKLNILDAMQKIEFKSSSAAAMRSDFATGKSGFSIYSVRGIVRYCSYAPIGLNDWYVVVMVKESFLRGKLMNLERYGLQLTVELVLVMLILLSVIMANRLGEQKKIRRILVQAAMMDSLTGIYNRKATEEAIEKSLRDLGGDKVAALLVIDVDDFKKINDQGGHLFGDNVLKEFANRLISLFGDEGIVGRVGGDEFVVFLRDGRDMEQIEEKISGLIHSFYVLTENGEKQMVSFSVGITQTKETANSFPVLYQLADTALYHVKQTGKGRLSS